MAAAGPSRLPYVELPAPTSSSSAAHAARVPTRDVVNGDASSHGSTTQESSNPAQLQPSINGLHRFPESDGDEDDEEPEDDSVQARRRATATYSSSDAIVHRALRPRTGYCYSTKMTYHAYVGEDAEDVHPEEPDRIVGIHQRLQDAGLLSRMDRIAVREAVKAEATLIHSAELWHKVNSFANQSATFYDINRAFFTRLSLYVNEHTALCARLSLGGVIETCRAVADGRIANAFAIVRPPGHHAEPEQAMGFCFYNNAAVAAAYLKTVYKHQGIRKILILDWDVHHGGPRPRARAEQVSDYERRLLGNGTQKAFWSDPDVLYISIHRYDNGTFYPGGPYGGADMVGAQGAEGRCVNIPWPTGGMGDADYVAAFQKIVMPIAYEFRPDFVIVSAGFDAAEGDQLGGCHVSPGGYAQMTHMLSALAGGRLVIALEGGYNVESISKSALECVKVLLGELPPEMPALVAQPAAVRTLHLVSEEQSRYWDCIQPTFATQNELANAGKIIPITEILKAHRTSYLYNEYGMYNVPLSLPKLEEAFKDQLLVSENLFDAETLVLLVHDMGNIRAELTSLVADIKLEKSFLLDTSSQVVEWVHDKDWALVDVNILAHSETLAGLDREKIAGRKNQLVLHVWDTIIALAENVKEVVLIGQSIGCNALINLVNRRSESCRERVKAVVQLFDMHTPMALYSNAEVPGLRSWYKTLSLAVFPSEQQEQAERIRVGNRYSEVIISQDPRPTHVLHDRWSDIVAFISNKVAVGKEDPAASEGPTTNTHTFVYKDGSEGTGRASAAINGLRDSDMDMNE